MYESGRRRQTGGKTYRLRLRSLWFHERQISRFGVVVHGAGEYPEKLRDATHPIELLYYHGLFAGGGEILR